MYSSQSTVTFMEKDIIINVKTNVMNRFDFAKLNNIVKGNK